MEATVNFTTTVAVSNLPADPSTGAKQDAQTTALGGLATQTTLAAVLAKLVIAPALDATVAAGNTLLSQIKALLPTTLVGGRFDVNIGASGVTVPVSGAVTTTGTSTVSGSVAVTNFPVTQPVSIAVAPALVASSAVIGHIIADSGSTVAVTALPALPAGANAIGSVTVTSAPTTAITAASLPLPSLASTAALQTTGNASLSSLDTKAPALGQALALGSVPVVLTAVQIAQLAQDASVLARCPLGQGVTAAARTVVGPSDASIRFIEGTPSGGTWTDLTPTTALNAGSTSVQLIAAATNRRLRLLRATLNIHTAAVNVAVFNGAGTWGTSTNLIDYFPVAASSLANNRDYTGDGVTCASGVFVLISTGLFTAAIAAPPAGVVFNGLYV